SAAPAPRAARAQGRNRRRSGGTDCGLNPAALSWRGAASRRSPRAARRRRREDRDRSSARLRAGSGG
ncbi:MAG: hypothetical protein ACK56I_28070, partial [bacterium]